MKWVGGLLFRTNASDLDEFVVSDADADLLAVLQTAAPVRVGVDAPEVVVLVDMTLSIVDGGPPQGRLGVDRVHAGHVQCHGIERCEHAHIGHDGHIVLRTAVAVGGHIDNQ